VAQLQHFSDTPAERSVSQHYLSTHNNYSRSFNELKKTIQEKRWQQQLFGQKLFNEDTTKTEMLVKEEKFLDESLEIGKNILAAAQEVKVSLAYQTRKLNATGEKIVKFAEMLPGIGFLMKRISARKRFNAIILGLAVSVCVCIFLYKIL
jgi:hypothetical protein